jgi:hypothetical protein
MGTPPNKQRNWQTQINSELEQAEASRLSGNEGKARVCARRAAGIAIGEYINRKGLPNPDLSAYDRLQFIVDLPGVSPRAREISQHLLLRVDEEFKLPIDADLIAETYELIKILLG